MLKKLIRKIGEERIEEDDEGEKLGKICEKRNEKVGERILIKEVEWKNNIKEEVMKNKVLRSKDYR